MRFFWRFRAPNLDPPRRISSFGTSLEEWVRTNYTFVAFKDLSDFLLQKSVSLFLGKKSLETYNPFNQVFLKRQPFFQKPRRFFLESPFVQPRTLHSNGSPCNYATWTSVKTSNDGKEKTESPLSCNRGASKNFLLKLEDEGGIAISLGGRLNGGKIVS